MFKLNIKDMLWIIVIMIVYVAAMFGLDYLGVDLAEPVNIPSGDTNPSMSPTGAMSGTIG